MGIVYFIFVYIVYIDLNYMLILLERKKEVDQRHSVHMTNRVTNNALYNITYLDSRRVSCLSARHVCLLVRSGFNAGYISCRPLDQPVHRTSLVEKNTRTLYCICLYSLSYCYSHLCLARLTCLNCPEIAGVVSLHIVRTLYEAV